MVFNRSHRFYSCLSFASVKVGGREICKMFSFFVFAPVFGFHCLAFIELVSWSLYLVSNGTIHNFAAYRWYTTTTYDIILPFYQQIAKPKDMALKLLRCVRWTCEIEIPADDTVNGLNPGVTCSTVV